MNNGTQFEELILEDLNVEEQAAIAGGDGLSADDFFKKYLQLSQINPTLGQQYFQQELFKSITAPEDD